MPGKLALYIARRFLMTVLGTFMAVFVLIVTIDLVELIRSNTPGLARFGDLVGMALLHAPSMTITAAPFILLLASMMTFAMLARSSELVVTRAAGVSVWRLLSPVLIAAMLLGIFAFAVYNPLASAFTEKFDVLEQRYFDRSSSRLAVSGKGLWLRQGGEQGQTVIRAQHADSTIERLEDVTIFQFDRMDRLYRRINAETALLGDQVWKLTDVLRWNLSDRQEADIETSMAEMRATSLPEMNIPTELTAERIQDSFAAPETISFWELPEFIALLDDSGFSSSRHRLHWLRLAAMPAVFVAMVLIGAVFSMRHQRFGGLGYMALATVIAGFGYFFLSDIAGALGASGAIPVLLAGLGPPLAAVLLSVGLLLHLEDG